MTIAPLGLLIRLVELYSLIILVRAVMSWIPETRNTKLFWYIYKITEPVLAPVRNIIPNLGIDISPIVVILILRILTRIIINAFGIYW